MNTSARDIPVTVKAKIFRSFADPSRLSILESLRPGSCTVNELVRNTGLSQTNVSNHLRCLYECGLVNRERNGRHVYYGIRPEAAERLMRVAEQLLQEIGGRIEACPNYDTSARTDLTENA